jgi:hypothetical protein
VEAPSASAVIVSAQVIVRIRRIFCMTAAGYRSKASPRVILSRQSRFCDEWRQPRAIFHNRARRNAGSFRPFNCGIARRGVKMRPRFSKGRASCFGAFPFP